MGNWKLQEVRMLSEESGQGCCSLVALGERLMI